MPDTIDRTITVVGQTPLRAGQARTGQAYTLYEVQTDVPVYDDGGSPCELRAFGLLSVGKPIDVTLEVYASSTGRRTWTVKPKDRSNMVRPAPGNMPKANLPRTPMQAQKPTPVDFERRLTMVERELARIQMDARHLQDSIDARLEVLTNLLTPTHEPTR